MTDRPWYRLHWATWVVAASTFGAIVYANGIGREGLASEDQSHGTVVADWHGWPWSFLERDIYQCGPYSSFFLGFSGFSAPDPRLQWHWQPSAAVANAAFAMAMLVGTAAIIECWVRGGHWRQFSLLGLLITTWTIAAVLLLYRCSDPGFGVAPFANPPGGFLPGDMADNILDRDVAPFANPLGGFLGIVDALPSYVSAPLVFGLICMLHSTGWLIAWLVGRS